MKTPWLPFVETFAQWKPSFWMKDDGIADKTLLTALKGSPKMVYYERLQKIINKF